MLPANLLSRRHLVALSLSVCLTAVLTGCGAGALDPSATGSLKLQGSVHGGQQPVVGSVLRLYTAGIGGNGTAAIDMLKVTSPSGTVDYVTTGAGGFFSITGDYTCANSTDQVYIVATGGNPGLPTPNATNPALAMMSALGNCGALLNQTAYPYLTINEVTTAASVWALAPFMTSPANMASSPTNGLGITNAFLNANLLVSPATGAAATLPTNLTIETGKLYALANVIAACVNSDGTTGCSNLFGYAKPPNGTTPTDTITAALDIVKNPSHNVSQIFYATGSQPPFASNLINPPNDWTMSLTVTGGALVLPTAIGIDALGNVWAADYLNQTSGSSALSAFSPQGTPYSSGTGYGNAQLSETFGLAIDKNNNVWADNEENFKQSSTTGSVSAFYGATSGQTIGSYALTTYDGSGNSPHFNFPYGMNTDSNGNIFVGNFANGTVSVISQAGGSVVASGLGSGYAAYTVAVTADGNHGAWLANYGTNFVTHVDSAGNFLTNAACCNGPNGIARDSSGNVWISNYYNASISEVADNGTVLINQQTGGGVSYPSRLRIDAGQNIWVANYHGSSISEIGGIRNATPGTPISSSTGYGLDANLVDPYDLIPDASGNVWVSNYGNNDLVMFFGLATPTATPSTNTPVAP